MRIFRAIAFSLLLSISTSLLAQDSQKDAFTPWYVGANVGAPMGISTFTSFSNGKICIGYNFGVLVGYRFNSIFSTNLSAEFGKLRLESGNYYENSWLGADGIQYIMPITGQSGHYYRDLYSSVSLQQYGLHLNVNLVPLFFPSSKIPFSFTLSPAIYGVSTQATLKTISGNESFLTSDAQFSLGAGGDLSVGYEITNNLAVSLSGGVNYIMAENIRIDGAPLANHPSNIIINTNVSLIWRFGKKQKRQKEPKISKVRTIKINEPKPTIRVRISPLEQIEAKKIVFPVVYFDFEKTNINAHQMFAVDTIVKLMNYNERINVVATGYTDKHGTVEVNNRYSNRRAQTIKSLLIKRGIEPMRIEIIGAGIDSLTILSKDARRVQISPQVVTKSSEKDLAKDSIIFPTVYFDFDKVNITLQQDYAVNKIVELMKSNPDIKITLTGFTDKYGALQTNKRYSIRRAEAIRRLLIGRGIESIRIQTRGGGVDTTQMKARWARRVEVLLQAKEPEAQ